MKCSEIREAISAAIDGEAPAVDRSVVDAHLPTCAACRRFQEVAQQGAARGSVDPLASAAPDLTEQILGTARKTRAGRGTDADVLRLGIALTAGAELLTSVISTFAGHGYDHIDHAAHESLALTAGICIGLIYVAARPAAARAYLPAVAVAVALIVATSTADVIDHETTVIGELPHIDLVAAFVMLCLLVWRPRRPRRSRTRGGAPTDPGGGLRLVTPSTFRAIASVRTAVRALVVATVTAILVLVAAPGFAHAVLEKSDPAPDSLLHREPQEVTLSFDEPVTLVPEALRVFGPSGERVDDGAVTHPSGAGQRVSVDVDASAPGTYLVSWRVISADSHPVSGAYTFAVDRRTAAPDAAPITTDRPTAITMGIVRWVGYAGSCLLLGGAVFLRWCWPAGASDRRARRALGVGAGLLVLGSAVALLLKGPYDAGLGLTAVGRPSLVREVLGTTYGHGLLLRLVATVVLAWAVRASGRRTPARVAVAAVSAVALLASFAMTGHAVAGSGRALAIGVDMVHVGAMSVWLGGLLVLAYAVAVTSDVDLAVVRRFSRIALVCVGVLVASGVLQALRQVDAWAALPGTTYGRELLVKLGLVAAMLAAAATSRLWLLGRGARIVEAYTAPAPSETTDPEAPAARGLRARVASEAVLGLLVLGVTSSLVATEPARSAYHPSVAANLTLGPDTVQVSALPSGDRSMDLHLYVFGSRQQPVDPREVTASVSLPDQDLGPLPITLRHAGKGHDLGTVAVPVRGDWVLTVTVRTSPIDEYADQVVLPIR